MLKVFKAVGFWIVVALGIALRIEAQTPVTPPPTSEQTAAVESKLKNEVSEEKGKRILAEINELEGRFSLISDYKLLIQKKQEFTQLQQEYQRQQQVPQKAPAAADVPIPNPHATETPKNKK